MLLQYIGSNAHYKIMGPGIDIVLDPMVPTFVPEYAAGYADLDVVREWLPGMPATPGRPILVQLAYGDKRGDWMDAFAGISTIVRLRRMYPASPFIVRCDPILNPLLPPYCQPVDTVKAGQVSRYYRDFKLSRRDNQLWFQTQAAQLFHGLERIFALIVGYSTGDGDYPEYLANPVAWDWIPNDGHGKIAILRGDKLGSAWPALADALLKDPGTIEARGSAIEIARTIAGSSHVICCGDSKWAALAGHLGKPLLMFLPEYGFKAKILSLEFYAGFEWAKIESQRPAMDVSSIVLRRLRGDHATTEITPIHATQPPIVPGVAEPAIERIPTPEAVSFDSPDRGSEHVGTPDSGKRHYRDRRRGERPTEIRSDIRGTDGDSEVPKVW